MVMVLIEGLLDFSMLQIITVFQNERRVWAFLCKFLRMEVYHPIIHLSYPNNNRITRTRKDSIRPELINQWFQLVRWR